MRVVQMFLWRKESEFELRVRTDIETLSLEASFSGSETLFVSSERGLWS